MLNTFDDWLAIIRQKVTIRGCMLNIIGLRADYSNCERVGLFEIKTELSLSNRNKQRATNSKYQATSKSKTKQLENEKKKLQY